MAIVVLYDPTDPTVAGRVTRCIHSAHTPDYDGEPNKLVNPELVSVDGVPVRYWKHSIGSVVEMSASEKNAVNQSQPAEFFAPHTSDGKPIVLPNMFRGDVELNYSGRGDDITNGIRFTGPAFTASRAAAGDTIVQWQFMEWVYLAGGALFHEGGKLGDTISYKICAPATAGSSNPGDGGYDKFDVGGFNMYIPNPQQSGGWDLNLVEKLNANVGFTKVVPVPAPGEDGFFDWDPATELVTLNASQKGKFNLFDAQIDLSNFLTGWPLLGAQTLDLTVPAIKPKRVLPHWIHEVTVHHAGGANTADVAWGVYTARSKTAG